MPYKYIEFKDIFLKASRETFIFYKYKYLLTITKIGKLLWTIVEVDAESSFESLYGDKEDCFTLKDSISYLGWKFYI